MKTAPVSALLRLGLGALLSLSTLAGCGSDAPTDTGTGADASEPLLPWAIGNTWTYRVTEDGVVSEKTTTVMQADKVGGTGPHAAEDAYFVVTKKGADQKDKTESYQAPAAGNPDRIVRYRELSYGAMTGLVQLEEYWDPPRIHADGSWEATATSWLDAYTEYKLPTGEQPLPGVATRDMWNLVSADEAVDTPYGHFAHSMHLSKAEKNYWYVRGVGKVRETGGQTEELVSYKLNASINALK
ncbi:MAG: hypothetical protein QM756_39830 [Polyangiaceae bacterium]